MATIASLIVSVEANTAQLVKGSEDVTKSLDKIGSGAVKMAGLLGIGFSVDAVLSFVKGVFDAAGKINDLSSQLGISTDAVQGFKYAAEQGGATLNDVGSAIQKMNQNLAGGDKATVQALRAAGLSFSAIRSMKPEDAFLAIADAIQGIPDPMVQSEVALTLFGKSAGSLLPGIKEGFRGVADGASKMSKDTIAELDRAGDAWATLGNEVTIVTGTILGVTISTTRQITSSWASAAMFLDNAFRMGAGGAAAMAHQIDVASKAVNTSKDTHLAYEGPLRKTKEETDAATKAAEAHAKAIQSITDKLSGAGAIKSAKDYIEALRGGLSVQKLTLEAQADINKVMTTAIDVYTAQGKVAPLAMRQLWVETMKLPPVVNGLGSEWKNLGQQIELSVPKLAAFGVGVQEGIGDWANLAKNVSKPEIPDAIKKVCDWTLELARVLDQIGARIGGTFGSLIQTAGAVTRAFDIAAASTERWGNSAGIAAPLFSSTATTAQKWGAAVQSGATIASGAMDVWNASANAGSTSAGALHGAMAGAKAGAAFGPWGMAIGAAAGALIGFIKNLNAGRESVIKFADSHGGFDQMHTKLLTLGAAGELLWIKLTQGVGKNSPAEAKKVIDEINAAFASQDAWMARLPKLIETYGLSWEQAGIKARQAHMDEIARGLIQDFADLSRAGFDVETITIAMSDAINAYVQQAMATGTEVPAAMRPLLLKMIELGTLTDAAGNKIEDLEGITFATTLTAGFAAVVSAINALTAALTGAGTAIDDLNRRRVRIPVDEVPGGPGEDDDRGRNPNPALAAARFNRGGGLSLVSSGGGGSRDGEAAAIDRNFLLVQIPKAITAALQKGAA